MPQARAEDRAPETATGRLDRIIDDEPAPAAAPAAATDVPQWLPSPHLLHSGLTLAAIMGLAVGTRALWNSYAVTRPTFAVAITVCYLVMLAAAILVLCVRSTTALVRIDVPVLVTAMALKVIRVWPSITGEREIAVDEGMLMDRATRALAAGRNPYLMTWPDIDPSLPTRLMDGHTAYGYGYPPFGIELGAVAQWIGGSFVGITVVSCLALLATAVIIFLAAPVPLRPLATLGILGLGTLASYTENAYPSLIAMPFLCLAAWRWTSIGQAGRLGRSGILRAAALGLAVCTHQIAWFLAVFLVVGLILIRRGELSGKATASLLARYLGVVAAVSFVVNVPFLITAPGAWLTGMFEPLLQHAVPHGQGIMGVSYYLLGGSGALDFYGHASKLLLAAMLVAYAVHIRWIGRAAVVLPWFVFAVATRSQDGYFMLTMPLWIVGLCTTKAEDFATAYRLGLPTALGRFSYLRSRTAGVLATVALFVPVAVCVVVAVVTPQPLDMRVISEITRGRPIQSLTVEVTNRSAQSITPHFTVTTGVDITEYWPVVSGPATIPADGTATYTLTPTSNTWKAPAADTAFLRAVSDHPQTMSSTHLRIRAE